MWNIAHGKITNENGNTSPKPSTQTTPGYRKIYYPSYPPSNNDGVYSQGNTALLTCDSGYVINHVTYFKSAPVFGNYTPSDGSTWKIMEKDGTITNQTAACIRGTHFITT